MTPELRLTHPNMARVLLRGEMWKIVILDEEDVESDPTLLIFLEDEESPRVTAHLNDDATCTDPDHIVAVFTGEAMGGDRL
jgi:hypothetical protein